MTFTPVNSLEEALLAASDDPMARPKFYETLVRSDLFLIQPPREGNPDGPDTLHEGDQVQLSTIEMNDKEYIPIFSSLERIKEVMQDGFSYVAVNALDLISMTVGEEMMLNPGSEVGKEFTKKELEFILDEVPKMAASAREVQPEGQILMGTPEVYPQELVEKLVSLFTTLPNVKRAWLANVMIPGEDEKPHSLVAIEVTENIEEVVKDAAAISLELDVPDPPVDYLQVTGEGGLEDYFLEETDPFYSA